MSSSNPVVHFEMPYKDAKRVAKFYKAAFGWNMDDSGKDMGDYVTAETTKTENGRPVAPGTINGGFFPIKPDWPAQVPSVVIAVKDIEAAMRDVKKAGGEILGKPMDIPGVGKYVSFNDSEGNRVSLLQP
ncbi:MAG TPA: VOC family protein [Candidatus Saccharimonadales bacterium]|nr:VOC family protein [Candidatus Saccharimonadales bacterium]